jgi:hypothetical protein
MQQRGCRHVVGRWMVPRVRGRFFGGFVVVGHRGSQWSVVDSTACGGAVGWWGDAGVAGEGGRGQGVTEKGEKAEEVEESLRDRGAGEWLADNGTLNRAYGFPPRAPLLNTQHFGHLQRLLFVFNHLCYHVIDPSGWPAHPAVTSNPMRFQFQFSPPRASHPMFENSTEQKIRSQVNLSHFTKYEKIQQNLRKFDQNAFDERTEQEFFENMKIG